MAASSGSIYQALLLTHISGSPPDADPQRASENFSVYQARMGGKGLKPDILTTEADGDYLIRMGLLYFPNVLMVEKAWGFINNGSASFCNTASVSNCVVSKSAVGSYCVAFNSTITIKDSNYLLNYNGYSGSLVPTSSVAMLLSQSLTGFTMSLSNINTPQVLADPITASFMIRSL